MDTSLALRAALGLCLVVAAAGCASSLQNGTYDTILIRLDGVEVEEVPPDNDDMGFLDDNSVLPEGCGWDEEWELVRES